MEEATLLLRRPIAVWVIFIYSLVVAAVAGWAATRIELAKPGTAEAILRDQQGAIGLVVSLIPATVLLLAGLSLFLLKRWTIWLFGLMVLIMAWSFYLEQSMTLNTSLWALVALAALIYVIWLRRRGVLR